MLASAPLWPFACGCKGLPYTDLRFSSKSCAILQAHHWPAAVGRARVTMRMSSGPMRDVMCVAATM